MDRNDIILPGALILIILAALVILLSGSSTFQMGQISFDYPNGWTQSKMAGDFSNGSLYSEVIFSSAFTDSNGQSQTAYIIIQMQKKTQNSINLPSTNYIVTNTTNSSMDTVNVSNITATQLGNYDSQMAEKVTVIEIDDYYYIITYITPPFAINQTSEVYNQIIQTFKVS
ncbi:MAG: hypothetical protein LLF83_02335 [Methanobacterium sp.]|nr:hypothetical protein [Methanobacterium sp.]